MLSNNMGTMRGRANNRSGADAKEVVKIFNFVRSEESVLLARIPSRFAGRTNQSTTVNELPRIVCLAGQGLVTAFGAGTATPIAVLGCDQFGPAAGHV